MIWKQPLPRLLLGHVWLHAARDAELARGRAALPAARHVLPGADCPTARGKDEASLPCPSLPFPSLPALGWEPRGCPQRWDGGSAAPRSDVAVTEKSNHFRACGAGFHCSSLMGSSFVSPYGAFSFSLPFQPFSKHLLWWRSWALAHHF